MSESAFDRRAVAKSLVGFLVAAALLYAFGYVLGWQSILSALASADPTPVVLACASSLVALSLWAKGWETVLASLNVDVPYRDLVRRTSPRRSPTTSRRSGRPVAARS
ncbi:hypothetical protein [Halogeometricum sp. CBA1124]|uniref:hypothetical protein n=1 Tax=Halogeometricum sp. CBA1124 TaxID=2668071 RepID=UPI0031B6E3D1